MSLHFNSVCEKKAFSEAVSIILKGLHKCTWKHEGVDAERIEPLWRAAEDYCAPYDTPSGHLWTSLDKFINRYVMQGYKWEDTGHNSFIFTKGKEELIAIPEYDENHYVIGFCVV